MNNLITCVLVDDEHKSCEVLKKMLTQYCPDVSVIGQAHTVPDAITLVKERSPEIVFLDIEIGDSDGFQFLQQLDEIDFRTIFVTAYNQYAIRAIKFSAMDYLLKPVSIEQVQEAIEKYKGERVAAVRQHDSERYNSLKENTSNRKSAFSKLAIPTLQGFDFIEVNDIIWMQASESYTIFHLGNKSSILSSQTMKRYEDMLCDGGPFYRIHHSHMINLNHVTRLMKAKNASVIMSDGKELEVAVRKKDGLLELIRNR